MKRAAFPPLPKSNDTQNSLPPSLCNRFVMVTFGLCRLHTGAPCRVVRVTVAISAPYKLQSKVLRCHMLHSPSGRSPATWSTALHRRSSRTFQVKAAWGDDIPWSPARVTKNEKAADGIGSSAAQKYTTPGQYLQVRLKGGKPGFYAIASTPEEAADGTVELLVRCRGENAEALCSIADSTEVEASPVDGPGFRVERAGPKSASQLFIFATGSGITPVKALIESGKLLAQERKSVRLFYGTHSPEMTPYRDIIPKWEASGVQVLPVYSADGKGYVQDVFEQENEVQDGTSVGVILCGHKDMTEKISKQMQAIGVSKEKILLNFG